MNDDNKNPQLNVAGIKPFTKFRAIELAICGGAVILGLLYLYTEAVTLAWLMPIYCCAFLAITVLRYFDAKAVGSRGFAAMLPVICWGVLTAAVAVATVAYFLQ